MMNHRKQGADRRCFDDLSANDKVLDSQGHVYVIVSKLVIASKQVLTDVQLFV